MEQVIILETANHLAAKRWAQYLDRFVSDWLSGELDSAKLLDIRGDSIGFPGLSSAGCRVAVIQTTPPLQKNLKAAMAAELNHILPDQSTDMIFARSDGYIIAVLLTDQENDPMGQTARLLETVESVCRNMSFRICVGKTFSSALLLPKAYEDCFRLMAAANASMNTKQLIEWDDVGAYSVLTLLPQHPNVTAFLKRFIYPLAQHPKALRLDLINTLETYFHAARSIKKTAELLYTHYNTVVYRLDRIHEILECDLDDPETALQIHIALKIYRVQSRASAPHPHSPESELMNGYENDSGLYTSREKKRGSGEPDAQRGRRRYKKEHSRTGKTARSESESDLL
jgi:purine catabolism regulator